jgi:hypothetical protein
VASDIRLEDDRIALVGGPVHCEGEFLAASTRCAKLDVDDVVVAGSLVAGDVRGFGRIKISGGAEDEGVIPIVLFGDVETTGNVQVRGTVTQGCSAALKEAFCELSLAEAVDTLADMKPVTFRYKDDAQGRRSLGFIAEEVPDILAHAERDRLSVMEIVAVLTKVVQAQQETIARLTAITDGMTTHAPARTDR